MARIMIVDDDLDMRSVLGIVVESSGHEAIYATGGWNALARISEVAPNLVLLDITLGDIEGMAVLRRIRSHPTLADLPVVVVSGHNTQATREEAMHAGASAFLAKPVDMDELLQTIRELAPVS